MFGLWGQPFSGILLVGRRLRIHSLVAELKTEDRIEMDKIKKCYGVVLADVWTETDIKKRILESCKAGQKNPQDKESGMRDISEIGNYYLLSFLWEILL